MSGRSLRRLPVLAHARHIGAMPLMASRRDSHALGTAGKQGTNVMVWLDAMQKVVDSQAIERGHLLQRS